MIAETESRVSLEVTNHQDSTTTATVQEEATSNDVQSEIIQDDTAKAIGRKRRIRRTEQFLAMTAPAPQDGPRPKRLATIMAEESPAKKRQGTVLVRYQQLTCAEVTPPPSKKAEQRSASKGSTKDTPPKKPGRRPGRPRKSSQQLKQTPTSISITSPDTPRISARDRAEQRMLQMALAASQMHQ